MNEQTHDPYRPRAAATIQADAAPDFAGPVRADVTDLAKAYDQDVPSWLLLSPELLSGVVERGDAVAIIDGGDTSEWLVVAVDPEVVIVGPADDQATIDELAGEDDDEDDATQPVVAADGEPGGEGGEGADEAQEATQPAYAADDVPTNAADVVAWIADADIGDDLEARARAAWAVEQANHQPPRKTVQAGVAAALDDVDAPE